MTILTLQPDAAGIDTFINSGQVNANNGTSGNIEVRGPAVFKGLLKFDLTALPAVPAEVTINSAIVTLWCIFENNSNNRTASFYRSKVEWYEGDQNGNPPTTEGSTWNFRNHIGSVPWAGGAGGASGLDYEAIATASTVITQSSNTPFDFNVTADIIHWYKNGNPNYGWWILLDQDEKWFRASGTGSSLRPRLVIDYTWERIVSPSFIPSITTSTLVATPRVASMTTSVVNGPGLVAGIAIPTPISTTVDTVPPTIPVITPLPSSIQVTTISPPEIWQSNRRIPPRYRASIPYPLLYITDGTKLRGGPPNRLNLLSCKNGFCLDDWRPSLAQYKDGGLFYDSPMADGRRPIMHRFQNAIETFELKAGTYDQNRLIEFIRELENWLERAIEYWESPWSTLPIYLVARSPYENNTRYAVIYKGDFPDVDNPYAQPSYSIVKNSSALTKLTLSLERGHWLDGVPGETSCVEVGNLSVWTWQLSTTISTGLTGQIYALVQTNTGRILAGSSDAGKIFRSDDDGATWNTAHFGSGATIVYGIVKGPSNNLYAAFGNGVDAQNGIWKSTNNGDNWTRILAAPAGSIGYTDIVYDEVFGIMYAVGPLYGTSSPTNALLSYSLDNGANWTTIGLVGQGSVNHHATVVNGIGFFGANNQYQQVVRSGTPGIGVAPYSIIPMTAYPTAFGGTAGLTIAGFTANQNNTKEVLWAITKSGNTEIWSMPVDGAGSVNYGMVFSLRSTVSSQTFAQMYPDPKDLVDNPLTTQRTIWAGASSRVYRSTNNGYTWQLFSTTPSGSVTSFLRSSSGRLLAGANAQVVSLESSFSSVQNTIPVGTPDTCEGSFVANKSNSSNLTNVKVFDASAATYTNILPAISLPVKIFPDPAAAGDILYLGTQTGFTDIDTGPFHSIVFNIGTQASGLTIVWEYWSGAAWSSVSTPQDNTEVFQKQGVQTFHWSPSTNWATTTVDSVTGWWIRARITAVSSPITPTQVMQNIYSANTPYIEIDEDQIEGDIPALAEINIINVAATVASRQVRSCMVGLRSTNRGVNFNAFLNCSDSQEPFGIIVQVHQGSYSTVPYTPTGRVQVINTPSSLNTWLDMISFTISTTIAKDYYGRYRAFIRATQQNGTAGQFKLRIKNVFGGSLDTVSFSKEVPTKATMAPGSVFHVLDMGLINIAASHVITGTEIADVNQIIIQLYCTSNTPTLYVCDLILIPVDEWAAHVSGSNVFLGEHIEIDSAKHFKSTVQGLVKTPNEQITAILETVSGSQAILQVRKHQRLWFFTGHLVSEIQSSRIEDVQKIQINKVQRYLTMRGVS